MLLYARTYISLPDGKTDTYTDLSFELIQSLYDNYNDAVVQYWDNDLEVYKYLVLNDHVISDTSIQVLAHVPDESTLVLSYEGLTTLLKYRHVTYVDLYSSGYDIRIPPNRREPTRWRSTFCTQRPGMYHQTIYNEQDLEVLRGDLSAGKLNRTTLALVNDIIYPTEVSDNGYLKIIGAQPYRKVDITNCIGFLCFPAGVRFRSLNYDTDMIVAIDGDLINGFEINFPPDGEMVGTERPMGLFMGHIVPEGEGMTRLGNNVIRIYPLATGYEDWMDKRGREVSPSYDGSNALTDLVVSEVINNVVSRILMITASNLRYTTHLLQDQLLPGKYEVCFEPCRPLINNIGSFLCYRKRTMYRSSKWWIHGKQPDSYLRISPNYDDQYSTTRPGISTARWLSIDIAH